MLAKIQSDVCQSQAIGIMFSANLLFNEAISHVIPPPMDPPTIANKLEIPIFSSPK